MSERETENPRETGDRPLSRGRRWLFRIIVIGILPLVLILFLELILRGVGTGYPPGFLVSIPGTDAATTNVRFGLRFFPPELTRAPERFRIGFKDPARRRIFVVGGSAALGDPEPAFGLARLLEVQLRHRFGPDRVEVINAAMVAINSHVVLPIVEDCRAADPDLFVIFVGNNEVVGPYGAGTVFGAQAPALGIIRSGLWLRTTRLGQLLDRLTRRGSSGTPRQWRGMEMFQDQRVRVSDPRLDTVYDHFQRNLEDTIRVARGSGAQVVVCTVPVNLRDSPPFASLHRRDLSPSDTRVFEDLYELGVAAEGQGELEEALSHFEQARSLDDEFADLHYRLGRIHAAGGRFPEARAHFIRARDLDALRFRADSRINETIRAVAARAGDGVRLVDAMQAFGERAEVPGSAGDEFFHEHVHLNLRGNYELARLVASPVAELLFGAPASDAPSPLTLEQCARQLAWTPWNDHRVSAYITALCTRAPFSGQIDHTARLAALKARRAQLEAELVPAALDQASRTYEQALAERGHDLLFRINFALLQRERGKLGESKAQWKAVLDAVPDLVEAHLNLGLLEAQEGAFDDAIRHYEIALALPTRSEEAARAHFNLGIAWERRGDPKKAEAHYRDALDLQPDYAKAHNNLGLLHRRRGDIDAAIEALEQAIRADPTLAEAHFNLGTTYRARRRRAEASTAFRAAAEAQPRTALYRLEYGKSLLIGEAFAEAEREFAAVLELEPENPFARRFLGFLRLRQRRWPEAEVLFREAVTLKPDYADAHNGLGTALASQGRFAASVSHFEEALRLDPGHADAARNLQRARARMAHP